MPKKIFVSHSQRDRDIRRTFNEIIGIAGLQPICMEFEAMQSPKWGEIKDAIQESETVFLLLGQNVNRTSFTQNWIAFEVGLACALGKAIWVFEKNTSMKDFPIPYVTDYMRYESLDKKEVFEYIRAIVEGYGENGQNVFIKRADIPTKYIPTGKAVRCPRCNSSFNYHNATKTILSLAKPPAFCPLCRRQIS